MPRPARHEGRRHRLQDRSTSYGYRDAWAIGYDGKYAIAVWVGRPDGASTPGLMGRTAAAPILFDAFTRISERRTPLRAAPSGVMKVSGSSSPAAEALPRQRRRHRHRPLPRSARADLVPARSLGARYG